MDKKILLSGAAALLLGASLFAAPASAALDLSLSGKASVKATMTDKCNAGAQDLVDTALGADASAVLSTLNAAYIADGLLTSGQAVADGGATVHTTNEVGTFATTGCGTVDNPVWTLAEEMTYSASSTLANGLSVTVSGDIAPAGPAITLGGAFGTVSFKKDNDTAVKASMVNSVGDTTVTGNDLGGHNQATAGSAGTGVLWQAPSVGGADLYVSYFPNADDDGLSGAVAHDTLGFGVKFDTGNLAISAGFEAADLAACSGMVTGVANAGDLVDISSGTTLIAITNDLLGGKCGDENLTAIGASMTAGDIGINAGYSSLETEGADETVMNLGISTTVGEYSLGLDWVNAKQGYYLTTVEDDQTTIGASLSTDLGDGVSLSLAFSNNSYSVAGAPAITNYNASAKIEASF